jgi:hypothetical protein
VHVRCNVFDWWAQNPECRVVPRDHLLPVNVALQLIDERMKHLKRELFEDLETGGEAM